eukprot:2462276-Rhodomonas_salina.2
MTSSGRWAPDSFQHRYAAKSNTRKHNLRSASSLSHHPPPSSISAADFNTRARACVPFVLNSMRGDLRQRGAMLSGSPSMRSLDDGSFHNHTYTRSNLLDRAHT